MKPILFNTEMVRAILDGGKTQTRRLCKINVNGNYPVEHKWCETADFPEQNYMGLCANFRDKDHHYLGASKPPYNPGDILYVRETWAPFDEFGAKSFYVPYIYKADDLSVSFGWRPSYRWRPSIHMPKEAARIFLKVTDLRVERLKDITCAGIEAEGIESERPLKKSERLCEHCPLPENLKGIHCYGGEPISCEGSHCYKALEMWEEEYKVEFAELWDSTVKRSELCRYGWGANPWVWVITFERISKEEAMERQSNVTEQGDRK